MPAPEFLSDISVALTAAATAYRSFSQNDFFEPETNFLPELADVRERQAGALRVDSGQAEASWTRREAHVQLGLGKQEAWGPGSVRWRVRQSEKRLSALAGKAEDFGISGRARETLADVRAVTKVSLDRIKRELTPAAWWREDELAASMAPKMADERERGREYRVWFATDRQPVPASTAIVDYATERDRGVHYGACDVFIPDSHITASLGSPWWWRLLRRGDDRLRIRRGVELGEDSFWRALRTQVDIAKQGEKHAVVFIHGYNTSFRQAALRTAQLGVDLRIAGAMAFFSWPSNGSMFYYPGDEAAIEASEPAITDFLVAFADNAGAEAVHIIAHSMGNRGLLRAVAAIAATAQSRTGKPFNQIILAAPDVDSDVFARLATAYRDVCERTTLYVASKDWAVRASALLHRYARAGFIPPVTIVDGIDTIDASNVGLAGIGHSYFGDVKQVVGDIHELMQSGREPGKRFGISARISPAGTGYWQLG
jgi:esterase/lipase superfamily enzyme